MSKQVVVKVMWGKHLFEDIAVDMDQSPMVFKTKIAELTNVEPARQKILLKAGTLGDEEWGKCKVKKNQTVMVMGTASDKILKAPTERTLFIENQTDNGRSETLLPSGLANLGNTCYMNSTLQCMNNIKGLEQIMNKGDGDGQSLGTSVYNLLKVINVSNKSPMTESLTTMLVEEVWTGLKQHNPQFNERTPQGAFAQQDADECWGAMLRAFEGIDKAGVRSLMGINIEETYTCKESEDEPVKTLNVEELQLSYNASKATHVHGAIAEMAQGEEVEKHSEKLGRTAVFTKKMFISRLPRYLVLKGLRFQWHAEHQRKILRPVKYQTSLDMFEFCSDELKQKLTPMRNQIREATSKRTERQLSEKSNKETTKDPEAMEVEKVETSSSFDDDAGSNNNGYYNLVAILSHQGRSADSGHYVGWCLQPNGSWLKFDDDKVSPVKAEQVLELCGGRPDAHIGYLLVYEAQKPDLSE